MDGNSNVSCKKNIVHVLAHSIIILPADKGVIKIMIHEGAIVVDLYVY